MSIYTHACTVLLNFDDILMKDSPACSTKHNQLYKIQLLLLFKVIINRSTVEPVYDATNNENETSLPPPTKYKIPTV